MPASLFSKLLYAVEKIETRLSDDEVSIEHGHKEILNIFSNTKDIKKRIARSAEQDSAPGSNSLDDSVYALCDIEADDDIVTRNMEPIGVTDDSAPKLGSMMTKKTNNYGQRREAHKRIKA